MSFDSLAMPKSALPLVDLSPESPFRGSCRFTGSWLPIGDHVGQELGHEL